MSPFSLPVRRPVATVMFFLAIFLLGAIAWLRIPVELTPAVTGDELYVRFARPGSEPEVVEREILLPLEGRVSELPNVDETWAEIVGSNGSFTVRFEPGADLKVRELDLRRLAAELVRIQPRGTFIDVSAQDLTAYSRFVMFVQITGMDDRNSLLDFVDERVTPRLLAVAGVSRVMAGGGAPREMTVRIDPDRCAAMGVLPDQVTAALLRTVSRERYLGGVEDEAGRTVVILDGRPRGVTSLADTRIDADRAVLLRHVADVTLGTGREERMFRVNGKPTVAMVVFQDEGANLIRLGGALRAKMDELREEFRPYGLDFVVNLDSSEVVEEQLTRLERLALSGFLIALAVLFLFLRQWRAVGVVAMAVPASLLTALALLYLVGQSINLITLFGLAVGIGMLVDNSVVVYEAVQRALEHGASPDSAAEEGVRRTVRAILAASVTNAIVFLPIVFADFEQTMVRSLLEVMALAIILPMVGSLLVAIGLVPLLARRLAAPAALARIETLRRRRERQAGLVAPDRTRGLFSGLLMVVLRRPGAWVAVICFAVVVTFIVAVTWFASGVTGREAPEAETIRFSVTIDTRGSLEAAAASFERLEGATMELDGVRLVESFVQEDGGALTVHLKPKDERPGTLNAARVREVVYQTAQVLDGVSVDSQQAGFGGGGGGGRGGGGGLADLLGQTPASVVLSGPEARELNSLSREVAESLESIPEVQSAMTDVRVGQFEYRVAPDARALAAFGLTADQVLPALNIVRREGVEMRTGFTLHDGREIPMTVRREPPRGRAGEDLRRLRLATPAGVLPLEAVADVRRMPPAPAIVHHNGRREVTVTYRLTDDVPQGGPARVALEEQIRTAIQQVHRPTGFTIETPTSEASYSWFRKILVPVVLLLFAVLAVTFESLTMPLLVMLSLPLTLLGATWALVLSGTPPDMMALVGALALIGLTVNPAILLVDRMQQRAWKGGRSAGAAALAAVRERARPVLMTAATTVAGLWPLALVTGSQNEIWPPFATIVMGGLVTSTLLTLLVIPVGFVFLRRLDEIFGRLGPWVIIGWGLGTAGIVTPLFQTEVITSLTWQLVTTVLVGSLLLGVIVLVFRRPEHPEPASHDGPPVIEVRYLSKTYGKPGPVGRAWHAGTRFAHRVLELGGRPFDPRAARDRLLPLALVFGGMLYLALSLQTLFWRIVFLLIASALASKLFKELRRARGKTDRYGIVEPGGPEGTAAAMMPWIAMVYLGLKFYLFPEIAKEETRLAWWVWVVGAVALAVVQAGRRTARRISQGEITDRVAEGRLRRARTVWRRLSRWIFGLDLPREQVHALANVHFRAERGMVGILGPNGAGKTTLLRNLAGILEPSLGAITLGGVPLRRLRRYLARYLGYLPQDFGLPEDLTAREYLEYYALHYELKPAARRRERIDQLLREVGLGERADEKIGSFSGGMRQRVAVARTLLRLPPVIIVDEPTVGLDPRERIRFRNLLSRLAEGRIVLFSTHVVEDVEVACERVIVLARGRIVFDGPPADLAHAASGKVWVAHLPAGEETSLVEGAMIVDQVPEEGGRMRTRVLHAEPPREDAEATPPTLEDGYLWLVGEAAG
jgi:multidrug efflux pump subunit AcrB/ABC-type multidrug transport system ATPase subunit